VIVDDKGIKDCWKEYMEKLRILAASSPPQKKTQTKSRQQEVSALLRGNWQDFIGHDASAIAELLVTYIASYLSKVADFYLPHNAAAGVTRVEFPPNPWLQKTRIPVLSCGFVYVILRSSRTPTFDRHRRTQGHSIQAYRASIASRGKMILVLLMMGP